MRTILVLIALSLLALTYQNCGGIQNRDLSQAINSGSASTSNDSSITGNGTMGTSTGGGTLAAAPTWRSISTIGAPTGLSLCPASVWTGTELLIIGGTIGATPVWGYNPATDQWRRLGSSGDVPTARQLSVAVWTGTEVLLTGGNLAQNPQAYFNDILRYDPVTGVWRVISRGTIQAARWSHTGAWTGSQFFFGLGGGSQGTTTFPSNLAYQLLPNDQGATITSLPNAPETRAFASSVNTPAGVFVWGGSTHMYITDPAAQSFPDGLLLRSANQTWTGITVPAFLTPRAQMAAAWDGDEAIYWGGALRNQFYGDGAAFNPATLTWRALPSVDAPSARRCAASAWTGSGFIVWGGVGPAGGLTDGKILR